MEHGIAPHDLEFEVEWLPDDESVLEGSPSRGFQTVEIVGYERRLTGRFAMNWHRPSENAPVEIGQFS